MKIVLMTILLTACSGINLQDTEPVAEVTPEPTKVSVAYSQQTITVQNGKAKYINFQTPQEDGSYALDCTEQNSPKPLKQKIPYIVKSNVGVTYYAESYFSRAKKHLCYSEGQLVLEVNVSRFPYKKEHLKVSKKKVDLSKKDLARVIRERKITSAIYKKSVPYLLFDKPFIVPLDSFITSHYGNQRIFNNKKRSQHLGNDFRAKVGVKIPSSNRGKVVFVGDLFYTGNVVIIDHGLNLFSLYAHLSKILVTEGTILNQGDIVGLSGMTGRVSGPHLHWGIKMNGHNIDGFSLAEESKKHFKPYESSL